jgi:hypothetical protein
MTEPAVPLKPTQLVALRRRREEVIELLSDSYAADLLTIEQFEHRLDEAHRANDMTSLEALVADLEGVKPTKHAPSVAMVPAKQVARSRNVVAIMGGATRSGQWTLPRKLRVFTLMGGADIDLREAAFPPGLTEISIFSVMGGVDVIVPPNLPVECDGIAIMGGFDSLERTSSAIDSDPDAPRLRITGFAMMGGVDVSTRLPGESAREARKRLKREQKEKTKLLKS